MRKGGCLFVVAMRKIYGVKQKKKTKEEEGSLTYGIDIRYYYVQYSI